MKRFTKEALKRAAFFLLLAAVLYAVLSYWANFSQTQSVVLSLALTSLYRRFSYVAPRQAFRFEPYYVTIWPNWYPLLHDYNLVKDAEEWAAIQNSLKTELKSDAGLFEYGISFGVLDEKPDVLRQLIYWYRGAYFTTEIDFCEKIAPVKTNYRSPEIDKAFGGYNPSLFYKWGAGGYELGLEVEDDWWDQVKSQCPSPRKEHRDRRYGTVRLTLAVLPYEEFGIHWVNADPYNSDGVEDKLASQESARRKFDWASEEPDLELPMLPTGLNHKYFKVYHDSI